MSPESAWNMFVFRDGRHSVAGATLVRDVADALRAAAAHPAVDQLTTALLLAGQLECALIDADFPGTERLAALTDTLATALIRTDGGPSEPSVRDGAPFKPSVGLSGVPEDPMVPHPRAALSGARVGSTTTADRPLSSLLDLLPTNPPSELKISPPEGFAYYALHPMDFATLGFNVPLSSGVVGVIGIRTIGVTLSALVLAALRLRGVRAERFSVRPNGHPYDRVTTFDPDQAARISSLNSQSADFLVVDEGPGMSGSSFLSVGDALAANGVPRERIAFFCSRIPDPDTLRASDGGRRWRSYTSYYAQKNSRIPPEGKIYVGGGDWRREFLPESQWPASWTQMERLKFLSPDRRLLFKFEGLGPFGQAVYDRARCAAQAGFAPATLGFTQGFAVYPALPGCPLAAAGLTPALLDRMADYCAFRASEFATTREQNTAEIETMLRFNVSEAFGCDLPLPSGALHTARPVIVDGRMLPHEWIETAKGVFKVDGSSHGDDHFFPGPADIAWDLAGAIVEWNMSEDAAGRFLARYRHVSGDDPRHRLPRFLLAYAVFRLGYCSMAAEAMRGSGEEHRLFAAHDQYYAFARNLLPTGSALTGGALTVDAVTEGAPSFAEAKGGSSTLTGATHTGGAPSFAEAKGGSSTLTALSAPTLSNPDTPVARDLRHPDRS